MTRWNSTATLIAVTASFDSEGNPSESTSETDVFCNVRRVGAEAYMAARSAGLHADAEVEVRSADYAGQQRALIGGREYEIEGVRGTGEFAVLTLAKRLSNGG